METKLKQIKRSDVECAIREGAGINKTISKNKSGNWIARFGFYYRMGKNSEQFAQRLASVKGVSVIGHGTINKPFRGGASVAQQSHFWVEFTYQP